MEIKIKAAFDWGETVFVVTDPKQQKRLITSIAKDWNGGITYQAVLGTEANWFQAVELSTTKDTTLIDKTEEE